MTARGGPASERAAREAATRVAPAEPAAAPFTLPPQTPGSLRLATWLLIGWAVLFVLGFIVLKMPSALGASNPVSIDRAAFTSANVAALAGFATDFARPDDFSAAVRTVFVLQTFAGIALSLIGGGVLLARLLGRTYADGLLVRIAVGLIAFAAAVGCLTVRPTESIGVAAFRGVAALGNGGVVFGDPPRPGTPAWTLALVPLSVLGSFGVVVLADLFTRIKGPGIKDEGQPDNHAGRVLTLTAIAYLIGMGLLLWIAPPTHGKLATVLTRDDALLWSARGWGLPVDFASDWPTGFFWAAMTIAIVGIGAAGTAGSIGLGWLFTFPRRLRDTVTNGLIAQLLLAAVTLSTLAWTEPTLPPARRILIVASAVMNLGLSHQPLSITGIGLLALAATVAIAKVLPLIVLGLALRSGLRSQTSVTGTP